MFLAQAAREDDLTGWSQVRLEMFTTGPHTHNPLDLTTQIRLNEVKTKSKQRHVIPSAFYLGQRTNKANSAINIWLSHFLMNVWSFLQNKPNCWALNKQVEKVSSIHVRAVGVKATAAAAGRPRLQSSSSSKSFLPSWGVLGPPAGLAMMICREKRRRSVGALRFMETKSTEVHAAGWRPTQAG